MRGKLVEGGYVLHDWNVGGEQRGVDWTRLVSGVVDVVGVDADDAGAGIAQEPGSVSGEERVAFEVCVGAPVLRPTGVDEYGLVFQFAGCEESLIDVPDI